VLNEQTGALVWQYFTGGPVTSSPVVAQNNVYFASEDNKIYAFNKVTASPIWSYLTGGPVKANPVVVEGRLFIGSGDSKLYAFGLGKGIIQGIDGGNVSFKNAEVEIPAGAFFDIEEITIDEVSSFPDPPLGWKLVSGIYDFKPSDLNFEKPVQITFTYNADISPGQVDVFWYNQTTSQWEKVTSGRVIDPVNRTISVEVTHFSLFGVFGTGGAATGLNKLAVGFISLLIVTIGAVFILRFRPKGEETVL
jgi:hypothetical protein